MIYLVCLLLNYVCMYYSRTLARRRALTMLTFVVLGIVVMARGRVGPDTGGTYEPMVRNLDSVQGTEPLFVLLLHILKPLFPSALTTVTIGLGGTLTLMLILYVLRADEEELFTMQAFFIPTQYFGSSISGQRSGIASIFFLYAMQSVRQHQRVRAIVFFVCAILTHYETLLALLIWALIVYGLRTRKQWLAMAGSVVLACGFAFVVRDYLLLKFVLYFQSDYVRSSPWSGASLLAISIMVVFISARYGVLTRAERKRLVLVNTIAIVLFIYIATVSISAFRLLSAQMVSTVYATMTVHQLGRRRTPVLYRRALMTIAFVQLCFSIRYTLQEDPDFDGNMLPYKFIWQEPEIGS